MQKAKRMLTLGKKETLPETRYKNHRRENFIEPFNPIELNLVQKDILGSRPDEIEVGADGEQNEQGL
ncbi:MAG: hypothetical protein WCR04_08775 [Fibrobacteraceae bacterium]